MKRTWLLFSQTVTILVAAYFVVATLQPQWLNKKASLGGISVIEAPVNTLPRAVGAASPIGSFAPAAKIASAAVVSINTSKAPVRDPRSDDPWFQFFFGDQANRPQAGLGSGVIVSEDGYILTNNHVVGGADRLEVVLTTGEKIAARIIGTDAGTDTPPATVLTGSAAELCEVAGQRATAAETALAGSGPDAEAVLRLMRTFA